jgi:2-hydroxychromene-2-carboxylate isomerase
MSRLQRKLSPLLSATLTHPRTRDARRRLADLHRRVRSAPHRVLYFHQVDDPYGHLAAQVLGELVTRYEIVLEPHLVGPPPDDAAPEPERLEAFARKDAADVAPFCGLEFPDAAARPAPESVELATRLLAGAIAAGRFEQDAARIGDALWRGGHGQLEEIARDLDTADEATARRAIDAGNALRRKRGHYLGAMLHYGGEWYWGVDRLGHLERRLQGLGVLRPGQRADEIVSRPDRRGEPPLLADRRLRLECFPSLRSPYTAIALRRVLALPERLPVEIVWRPVLPMVMRGLPVPSAKRLYILFDTKRELHAGGLRGRRRHRDGRGPAPRRRGGGSRVGRRATAPRRRGLARGGRGEPPRPHGERPLGRAELPAARRGGRARLQHLGTGPALARRGDLAAARRPHRSVRRY